MFNITWIVLQDIDENFQQVRDWSSEYLSALKETSAVSVICVGYFLREVIVTSTSLLIFSSDDTFFHKI